MFFFQPGDEMYYVLIGLMLCTVKVQQLRAIRIFFTIISQKLKDEGGSFVPESSARDPEVSLFELMKQSVTWAV